MFNNLNADIFIESEEIYQNDFINLLEKIQLCYELMIKNEEIVTNDENDIRDVLLLKYLKNDDIRSKDCLINGFIFDREVQEDKTNGRVDIKISTPDTCKISSAYYTIECKRLDDVNVKGKTGLNGKYIEDGIVRFIDKKYSSYYEINAMIGFIVKSLDINNNINDINNISDTYFKTETNTALKITNFKSFYSSSHIRTDKIEITLYHLMFDFSKNIK